MRVLTIGLAAAVLLLSACDGSAPAPGEWGGSVEDSAGVRIVSSPAQGIWTDADRWTLEEEVRMGVESGDSELEFGMVIGVDADDEGYMYVVDQLASRVRVFDPEGELVRAFGRAGSGPGELSAQAMGIFIGPDGQIAVPDLMNQRLSRFSPEGETLTAAPLDLNEGIPIGWASAGDRTVYAQRRIMALPGTASGTGDPDATPTDVIVALGPEGRVADTLATLPQGEMVQMGSGGMPEIRMFAPEPVWTVLSDGRFVSGLNSEYSLEVRGADGEMETIVRRDFTRRAVTTGDRSGIRDNFLSAWEEAGIPADMARQMTETIQFEEQWPALTTVLGGPDGTLWVQRVDPDEALELDWTEGLQNLSLGSRDWDVFDPEGRYLGTVEMPDGFVPMRVRGDLIYGIHRDDLGIQRVVRLRVVRGQA